jgi:hypothetical protein
VKFDLAAAQRMLGLDYISCFARITSTESRRTPRICTGTSSGIFINQIMPGGPARATAAEPGLFRTSQTSPRRLRVRSLGLELLQPGIQHRREHPVQATQARGAVGHAGWSTRFPGIRWIEIEKGVPEGWLKHS